MKIFNSKRKIPIFHCATSKTELANIPGGMLSNIFLNEFQAYFPIIEKYFRKSYAP